MHRRWIGIKGNVAVEFALLSPILLAMISGAVDFGRLIETRTIFHSASRVGMQVALADPDNTDLIESAILSTLGEEADGATVTISENCACFDGSEIACDGSCSTGSVGRFITIQIDGSHDLLFDYPGVDDPTDIQIEATFRVQ